MQKYCLILLVVLIALSGWSCSKDSTSIGDNPPSTARYRMTFKTIWDAANFPTNFPPNRHFSDIIGTSHAQGLHLWEHEEIASNAIESVAELGVNAPLENEINTAIANNLADQLIVGDEITVNDDSITVEFDLKSGFPLVSFVSMIAPSPDWFVGVDGLALFKDNAWVERIVVDLLVYDSGSDNGATFIAPNSDTSPRIPISLLSSAVTDTDFLNGAHRDNPSLVVATLKFERLSP